MKRINGKNETLKDRKLRKRIEADQRNAEFQKLSAEEKNKRNPKKFYSGGVIVHEKYNMKFQFSGVNNG